MCQEAALGPIRELGAAALRTVKAEEVRHINEQVSPSQQPIFRHCSIRAYCCGAALTVQDFANAVRNIRPSVSKENLATFQKWADQYGVAR